MPETLLPLPERFEGIPGMMQGGYVAALAAAGRAGAIRVRIRRPLRAGDELTRTMSGDDSEIRRAGEVVMVGSPTSMHVSDPGPIDLENATAAASAALPFELPFPTCVGCGESNSGLGFQIRPLPGTKRMVAVWTPALDEAQLDGHVPREHVWTVIDCLTSWCVFVDPPERGSGGAVTGNIAMEFVSDLVAGQTYVLQSWRERDDEQSIICGGAIHDHNGALVALADQELVRTDGWGMEIPTKPLC